MMQMALTGPHRKRYREIVGVLVRYGFAQILVGRGLPEIDTLVSVADDSQHSSETAPVRLREALETLGPTFMKLGQLLSTRPDLLPPPYIVELRKLQDRAPELPFEQVEALLTAELSQSLENVFQFVEARPLGAASLAVVHAGRLKDGTDVAIKLQRPDIEDTIRTDLDILRDVARLLGSVNAANRYYDLREITEEFAYTLWQELDYEQEGHHAELFYSNFQENGNVIVPRIYWELSTPRLLVMTRLTGIKIDDVARLTAAGYDRRRIAEKAARLIMKEILEDGFFHADPHPGNLIVMRDEAIGVLDFGIVGWLPLRTRVNLAQGFMALASRDVDGLVTRLIQLGALDANVDRESITRDLTRLLRKYYTQPPRHFKAGDFLEDLTPVIHRYDLRVPTELWLMFKTLAVMQGVGMQLDPHFDIFADSRPYLRRLALQGWSPATLGESATRAAISLTDLVDAMPDLMRQVSAGEIKLNLRLDEQDTIFNRVGQLVNRVTTAIILAAIIIGIALLLPNLNDAPLWFAGFLSAMMLLAVLMGFWLAWQSLRDR